jgi:hypothetical protein
MIFKALRLYRLAKKGSSDPTGLVVEELRDAVIGTLVVPSIIVTVVLVLLGILGFSDLLFQASVVARIFFWIVLIGGVLWGIVATAIGIFVSKLLRKGEKIVKSRLGTSQIPNEGV